jgi:hypothetical protein
MKRTLVLMLAVALPAAQIGSAQAQSAERAGAVQHFVAAEPETRAAAARAAQVPPSADSERYGSLATGMPYDHEVCLGPNTRRIGVWRLQTVRFVAPDGRSFTWRFDGLPAMDEFPLAAIAPAGLAIPAGIVVSLNGEIPISP